ncbi:MAG: hypothetical protein H0W82_07095 [Actinobacteria bacterium]|nr:hypothetical protein [Actinomycetota bacterium]
MSTKADYTDEEWAALLRAPIVAGMAISIADPGGPIEVTKELMATIRAVTAPQSQDGLVTAVSQEIQALAQERKNPAGDFKPSGPAPGDQVLEELKRVRGILTAKATPEEAKAFGQWLLTVAQQAADAAKEGGFMGFGGEQVSSGEEEMLSRLRTTLGVDGG